MEASLVPDISGRQLGSWLLERRIGVGSFGSVYAARNQNIEKLAAIKILHPHMAQQQDLLRRFLGEASAASRTRHTGVIEFYDGVIAPDGVCYLVMELCHGQSLDHVLGHGPLGSARTMRLGARLADALHAVHACSVVHRDLKPENILLLGDPPNPETPKILDFGIAKLRSGPKQTLDGTLLGTLMYMSPEQCQTLPDIDHRSDIYSLGIILYQCLTGRLPFDEQQLHGWLFAHINKPVPDPALLCPQAPAALCQLLLRMLAKEPKDRPQSMEDVRAALDAIAASGANPLRVTHTVQETRPITPRLQPPPQQRTEVMTPAAPAERTREAAPGSLLTPPGTDPVPTLERSPSRRRWLVPVLVLAAGALGSVALTRPRTVMPVAKPPAPAVVEKPAPPAPVLPAELLPLADFAVQRQQVRISEFHAFVSATRITRAARWPWDFKVPEALPMNNVAPELAARYCAWRFATLAGRLPSPAELSQARPALPADPRALADELTTATAGAGQVGAGFRCVASVKGARP